MGLSGYSHASIIRWADDTFPNNYHHLPGARDLTLQTHPIPIGLNDCLKGLVVGCDTDDKGNRVDVLAWLEGGDVEVGYVIKRGKSFKAVRYEIEEELVERIEGFVKPFCWVWKTNADTETTLARFGALARYYLLAKGSNKAIKGNMSSFEEHFKGACRDVAAAENAKWVAPEEESDSEPMETTATAQDNDWVEGEDTVNEQMSSLPPGFRYDFEVFVDKICGIPTPSVPNSSLNYDSVSLAHTPGPSIDTNTTAPTSHLEEQRTEITSLRAKIQLQDQELVNAKGRASKAENEAANWQLHSEQAEGRACEAEERAGRAEDEAANWQLHYEQEAAARRKDVGAAAVQEEEAAGGVQMQM